MGFIIRLLVNAAVLILITRYVSGIHVDDFGSALIAALVLGIVNAILKPILVILSLPLEVITLGLFTFVINAALFLLVGQVHIPGFHVDNFGAAFIGALIMSIVSFVLSSATRKKA